MAKSERSRARNNKKNFKKGFFDKKSSPNKGFDVFSKGKKNFRDYRSKNNDSKMTNVICSSCGKDCKVPFKPTSNKPIYCRDCFTKKGKDDSKISSSKDLDLINEKLNKIMKALKIR